MLVQKLPPCKNLFSITSEKFLNSYKEKNPSHNILTLHSVSEQFVFKELCNLKPDKSTGLDNIPARFLKDGAVFLKMSITFIINMSIAEGIVPDEFKAAEVKPLFKKGCRSEVGNYIPIYVFVLYII